MQSPFRLTRLVAATLSTLLFVAGSVTFAQSGNTEVGTWKLNAAKSTYSPGPAQKSSTVKLESAGAGIRGTIDGVDADGTMRHWTFTAMYDSKDMPITGNSQNGDVIARTRVDANTVRSVYKRAGKVSVTQVSVVSADGKIRTTTTTGTNAAGQAVKNVAVYDRE